MAEMRLILHIGTEKTGTTLLQDWLYSNQDELSEQGVFLSNLLGKSNNRKLVAYFRKDQDDFWTAKRIKTPQDKERYFAHFLDEFAAEIKEAEKSHHTMIITSEHFHSRLLVDSEVGELAKFCRDHFSDTRILCYLREQSAMRRSQYSTAVKNGSGESFEEFKPEINETDQYYNYYDLAKRWERSFGRENMNLRVYDPRAFVDEDLRKDFLTAIEVPLNARKLDFQTQSANESLKLLAACTYAAINRAVPLFTPNGYDPRNRFLKRITQQIEELNRGEITDPFAAEIYNRFRDSNRKLFAEYFDDKEIFEKPAKLRHGDPPLEMAEVARIVGVLVYKLTAAAGPRLPLDSDVDLLWDVALKCDNGESVTREEALRLLEMAHRSRPNRTAIKSKIDEWRGP